MKLADVKWDNEELRGILRLLRDEWEKLGDYEGFLQNFRQTIADNWRSQAGAQYQERLGIEVDRIRLIRDQVREQTDALEQIIGQFYGPCEEEVRRAAERI